jgi:hypothetical protein
VARTTVVKTINARLFFISEDYYYFVNRKANIIPKNGISYLRNTIIEDDLKY